MLLLKNKRIEENVWIILKNIICQMKKLMKY